MIIAVPREIMAGERRVATTPEVAGRLVADGAQVYVQRGAGEGALFADDTYTAVGARIEDDPAALYARADVILKVKEPQVNPTTHVHEIDLMHAGQVLITFLHPASPANHQMVRLLAEKGVTALTLDGVPRITRAQGMDALTSMSTCAGYKGALLAADALPRFVPQMFSAAGMAKPCQALVIGAGVAGLQALATLKRLGAAVQAMDIRPAACEQAKSLGAKIAELDIPEAQAQGEGGYARQLSEAWLAREREAIARVLPDMDIVFLSALVPSKVAPVLITQEMVRTMRPGAAIVDVSIDQGGNCAITPPGETRTLHGVTIIGIKNIPGLIPASSSWMFAQNMYNLVQYLTKDGRIALDAQDEIVRGILTTVDGKIVHEGAREAMGL